MIDNYVRRKNYANPIVGAIAGFSRPNDLYVIVDESWEGIYYFVPDMFYLEVDNIKEIKFFGYKEQCEKNNNFRFKGKILKMNIGEYELPKY